MTPPTDELKDKITDILKSLYDQLHETHFCVGPADDPNLLRMPKVGYNTGGDINRQKATWHKVVHEAANTIINSPQDVEQDCWFSANVKSSGKLDRGSEPFKSYKLGQRQGGGQNKWTIQTVIRVLKNPWMQAMGRHRRDVNRPLSVLGLNS
ncbi:hypothetical protein MMC28_007218 [Mycoblastus sanguinarius]|nr:hypothetical protein [Mycoblastus sanguinarius]